MTAAAAERATTSHRNEVYLVGEITTVPEERTFADGRVAVTFRVAVRAEGDDGTSKDSFDITVTNARTRNSALTWSVGDVVEVEGTIRRKFHKIGAGWKAFVVIEASRAKRQRH